MANIEVNTNSWITDEECRVYLEDRINAPAEFIEDSPEGEALRKPHIISAWRFLSRKMIEIEDIDVSSGFWDADDAQAVQDAQCEQALYQYISYGTDAERRIALQKQGVVEAGIVKEEYGGKGSNAYLSPDALDLIPPKYFTQGPKGQPTLIK